MYVQPEVFNIQPLEEKQNIQQSSSKLLETIAPSYTGAINFILALKKATEKKNETIKLSVVHKAIKASLHITQRAYEK